MTSATDVQGKQLRDLCLWLVESHLKEDELVRSIRTSVSRSRAPSYRATPSEHRAICHFEKIQREQFSANTSRSTKSSCPLSSSPLDNSPLTDCEIFTSNSPLSQEPSPPPLRPVNVTESTVDCVPYPALRLVDEAAAWARLRNAKDQDRQPVDASHTPRGEVLRSPSSQLTQTSFSWKEKISEKMPCACCLTQEVTLTNTRMELSASEENVSLLTAELLRLQNVFSERLEFVKKRDDAQRSPTSILFDPFNDTDHLLEEAEQMLRHYDENRSVDLLSFQN